MEKPRIKRSDRVTILGFVLLGRFWQCNGITGMTPELAYQAWIVDQQRMPARNPPVRKPIRHWSHMLFGG